MPSSVRRFAGTLALSLLWSAPAQAQGAETPVLAWGAALVGTALVLVVICAPARRG